MNMFCRNFGLSILLAVLAGWSAYAGGGSNFGPPQGSGSGSGGGVANPLTADLDADAHSLLDVGQINFGPATVSTPAIRAMSGANGTYELVRADGTGAAMAVRASHSGGVYYESADSANYVRPHSGGVDVVVGSGTLSLDANTVLGSGKTITGGTLTWTSWTPTGSWSTNTTYAGYYCVVGKMLHLRITVTTSGAPTATNLAITNLPGSYVADETAMLAPTTGATLGMGTIIDSGTTNYGYVMARWADGPNTIPLVVLNTTAGQFQNVTDAFPMVWGASDQLQFTAMVPIQ